MIENSYIYKKEVDWSLLNQGLSIPLDIQVIFKRNLGRFIGRGESKDIYLFLEGISYKVKLVNQKFNESRYPTHKDIVQIRYHPNDTVADTLRQRFRRSYEYLSEQRAGSKDVQKRHYKIPAEKMEYLAIYTTEYEDTYLLECITQDEADMAFQLFAKEEEQAYEANINYMISDPDAKIEEVLKLNKVRRLNRAIGENLKMLYDYRCQICGSNFGEDYDAHIVECHHIVPFVSSFNNDSSNQIIICPNHHRIMHYAEPDFNRKKLLFVYKNGVEDKVILNKHLIAI